MKPAAAGGHFASRWRGEVPLSRLFWRDTLIVGSAINLVATFGALVLLAAGAPTALAAGLHFAPMPYNLFLVAALWRLPQRTPAVSVAAIVWLALVTLL